MDFARTRVKKSSCSILKHSQKNNCLRPKHTGKGSLIFWKGVNSAGNDISCSKRYDQFHTDIPAHTKHAQATGWRRYIVFKIFQPALIGLIGSIQQVTDL